MDAGARVQAGQILARLDDSDLALQSQAADASVQALRAEIGHRRGGCPYDKFLTLNSGSESVSLAGRIADTNTKLMTDPGGRHEGKRVKRIAMKGAFHGRTELPCLYSDSSKKAYAENLASWKHHENQLITIEPYSIEGLKQAFADADAKLRLEAILHPRIQQTLQQRSEASESAVVAVAIPLLGPQSRARAYGWLDRVLIVEAPPELQIARIRARDGSSQELAAQMVAAQLDSAGRLPMADDVLINDGDLTSLQHWTQRLLARYRDLATQRK